MKIKIRSVRLRIRYKRRSDLVALGALLTLALAIAAFLGTLAWGQKEAAASGAQAAPAAFTGMRKYYMTLAKFHGNETLTACAPGYHMASLWEILDPSNLEYNTDLGRVHADSAPPAGPLGWVRTGWDSSTANIPGQGNCSAWTTDVDTAKGTIAGLVNHWTGDNEDIHVWMVGSAECDALTWVWCVEDTGSSGYLPLVLKD